MSMRRPVNRFAPQKFRYSFWSKATAAAVVLFPLSLQRLDFRATFSLGLSISAYKSSPAYGAFEDVRESYESATPPIPETARIIRAGETFTPVLATEQTPVARRLATVKGITVHIRPAAFEPQPVYVAGEDIATASVGALAQKLAQAELRRSGPGEPTEKILRSQTGTQILVRRTIPSEPGVEEIPAPREEAVTVARHTVSYSGLTTRTVNPNNMRPLWLSGQIEMTGGLAFIGSDTQMVIQRTFNGERFEQGRIWVTEGKFEIHVKQPAGFLVAELRTRDGRVLGRGEVNLLDLHDVPPRDSRIADLRIALHPTAEGASFRTISGHSHNNQNMPVASAKVEIQSYSDPLPVNSEGEAGDPTLSRDSTFVARASAKNHWPSMVVGQAQVPQDIRLFSNSMVDALIGLNLEGMDKKEAYQQSVVWGRLTRDGKPVAGAVVEMAGAYSPIYFSELYLPDKKAIVTSQNGVFAFVKVRAGVQALRVRIGGRIYPAQIFPTEGRHVSYVEFSLHDKQVSQFRVFDGLDMSKPLSAQIRMVGSDEVLPIGRDDFVEYSTAANPFVVEADAGADYEISRVTVSGSPHVVHVPLVGREWLNRLAGERRVTMLPRRGTIVGYMDNHDYEVELTGYAPGEPTQIVYFDAKGAPLEAKVGVAGGGFVIFNAPMGLQTLYVHPMQSRETFSQVVVAEPEFVQVITH